MGSSKNDESVEKNLLVQQKSIPHRFDYDSYKILYSYVMGEGNKVKIQKGDKSIH